MIFFVIEDEKVFSTCMVLQIQPDIWEICKFATNEKFKDRGAGKAVFQSAIDYTIKNGAEKISIYSNRKLKAALHIYKSFGFKEITVDSDDYDCCDYQSEMIITLKGVPTDE